MSRGLKLLVIGACGLIVGYFTTYGIYATYRDYGYSLDKTTIHARSTWKASDTGLYVQTPENDITYNIKLDKDSDKCEVTRIVHYKVLRNNVEETRERLESCKNTSATLKELKGKAFKDGREDNTDFIQPMKYDNKFDEDTAKYLKLLSDRTVNDLDHNDEFNVDNDGYCEVKKTFNYDLKACTVLNKIEKKYDEDIGYFKLKVNEYGVEHFQTVLNPNELENKDTVSYISVEDGVIVF